MTESSPRKSGIGWWIVAAVLAFIAFSSCNDSDDRSSDKAKSGSSTTASSRPTTSRAPYEHQHMPGNGYHNIGGVDGKDWGVWQSTGSPQPCSWSIRLTDPYGPATILREGTADPGQSVRVTINPPGDVSSISGVVKATGGRVVFQTSGCGSWTLAR